MIGRGAAFPARRRAGADQRSLLRLDEAATRAQDVTGPLEIVPRSWKVIQTVRETFPCRPCGISGLSAPERRDAPEGAEPTSRR